MISGFDFPGEGPGSDVDARGMYPPELYGELLQNVGRHPIDAPLMKDINRGRLDLALEKMLDTIRRKAATAKYLLRTKPWDCYLMLFGETDGGAHQFWKYGDPKSPLFTEDPPGVRDALLRIYQELDRQTGELLDLAPADSIQLMISDHGFGGVSNTVLYPNCWLREQGFLQFRGGVSGGMARFRDRLKRWAIAALPGWLQRFLYRYATGMIGRFEAKARYGNIDWSKTEAYFDENPYYPAIRINLKGRQPQGIVEPGRQYEEVRNRLIAALESWRNPETGEPIIPKAFRREEVYSGECLEEAHDIIPKWALCRGYNYAFKHSAKSPGQVWLSKIEVNGTDYSSKSGTHRDGAVFIARGPGLRAGSTVEGVRIIDLAPTILSLLGVPVPADMDGRVLDEIFGAASAPVFANAPTVFGPQHSANGHDSTYSAEDEEMVTERLKALGYVE